MLAVCRTLVALAPLPVVCNNPGCGELSGVSEAAAARYVCAGCGCRYCSAACQAAGWRGHKKACRRMAAYGVRVDGKQQLPHQRVRHYLKKGADLHLLRPPSGCDMSGFLVVQTCTANWC
jgi:hypothetical protein